MKRRLMTSYDVEVGITSDTSGCKCGRPGIFQDAITDLHTYILAMAEYRVGGLGFAFAWCQ